MWTCRSSCRSVGAAVCLVAGIAGAPARAADGAPSGAGFACRVRDAATRFVLSAALEDASRALAEPRCQEVLDVFRDAATGQPLRVRLATVGTDAPGFLRLLVFYDGRDSKACAAGSGGPMAATEVGSHVVWVCPGAFGTRGRSDPLLAETIVIHEMLHALGLGENPPSSLEITAEVRRRCAR